MNLIEIYSKTPNPNHIKRIIEILNNDGILIFPTDTVYAFVCISNSSKALEKLISIKSNKLSQLTLSFFFKDFSAMSNYIKSYDNKTFRILKKCLPGPYTFIMESQKKLPKPFHKRKTIGVRMSKNPIIKAVLKELDIPIVTSSLHDIDQIVKYTTDPKIIFQEWTDKVDLIIDNGYGGNMHSTIIDLTKETPLIVRRGKGSVNFL